MELLSRPKKIANILKAINLILKTDAGRFAQSKRNREREGVKIARKKRGNRVWYET